MNITIKLFIILTPLMLMIGQARAEEPRLFKKGKDFSVSIYNKKVVIQRNIDGEKKEIDGLLWSPNPGYRYQPEDFFDNESNMAIFLMETHQYLVVDIGALFKKEKEEQVYEIIEGAVATPSSGVNRSNKFWVINGIYPNKTITGSGSAGIEFDKGVEFTLFLSGEKAYTLETTSKEAPRIMKMRAIECNGTTERRFRYVFK